MEEQGSSPRCLFGSGTSEVTESFTKRRIAVEKRSVDKLSGAVHSSSVLSLTAIQQRTTTTTGCERKWV